MTEEPTHYFYTADAKVMGVERAVIFYNIKYWLNKNQRNGKNIKTHDDGKEYFWTYNSAKAFNDQFNYIPKSTISRHLKWLRDKGYVISNGSFNSHSFDRTLWYTTNDYCTSQNELHVSQLETRSSQNEATIPDINTDINTDKEKNNITKKDPVKSKSTGNKFIKPTVDEINDYCTERNNTIDAEAFFDYYEMKGWKIGTNKISCWKSCVRTWERRNKQKTLDNLPADIKAKLARLSKDQYKKVIAKFSHKLKDLMILPGNFGVDETGKELVGYCFIDEGEF